MGVEKLLGVVGFVSNHKFKNQNEKEQKNNTKKPTKSSSAQPQLSLNQKIKHTINGYYKKGDNGIGGNLARRGTHNLQTESAVDDAE